jgi:hypothetical protein
MWIRAREFGWLVVLKWRKGDLVVIETGVDPCNRNGEACGEDI